MCKRDALAWSLACWQLVPRTCFCTHERMSSPVTAAISGLTGSHPTAEVSTSRLVAYRARLAAGCIRSRKQIWFRSVETPEPFTGSKSTCSPGESPQRFLYKGLVQCKNSSSKFRKRLFPQNSRTSLSVVSPWPFQSLLTLTDSSSLSHATSHHRVPPIP